MDTKSFLRLAGLIFALVALAHLARALLNWPIMIAGWSVPMWLSWVAFVVAGALSWFGWSLAKK
jgi:hypothetical protein